MPAAKRFVARAHDVRRQGVTDGLQKLFNNRALLLRPLRPLRNLGLAPTNGQPRLKNRLIRRALGRDGNFIHEDTS